MTTQTKLIRKEELRLKKVVTGDQGNDLRKRTMSFALRIVRMFSALPKTTGAQVLGKQVLRSGTSVGQTIGRLSERAVSRSSSRNAATV